MNSFELFPNAKITRFQTEKKGLKDEEIDYPPSIGDVDQPLTFFPSLQTQCINNTNANVFSVEFPLFLADEGYLPRRRQNEGTTQRSLRENWRSCWKRRWCVLCDNWSGLCCCRGWIGLHFHFSHLWLGLSPIGV